MIPELVPHCLFIPVLLNTFSSRDLGWRDSNYSVNALLMATGKKQDASPGVPAHFKFCLHHLRNNSLVTARHKTRVKRQVQPTMRPKGHMAKSNVYWKKKYIPPKEVVGRVKIFWTITSTITDIFWKKYSDTLFLHTLLGTGKRSTHLSLEIFKVCDIIF